jgi:hypothetical protein
MTKPAQSGHTVWIMRWRDSGSAQLVEQKGSNVKKRKKSARKHCNEQIFF